ncbi:hypothetical protein RP726_05470 [Candidatus Methylospira mobilis]|uniref:hypothetical protein n=1 Tax=Candidatus Methylospira mobilis TaxID=1808979 RepID=UPI0028E4A8F6|nr:hypothetical protein [Candidatus Methylospira mobilis]WNV05861.1 hypothetical protein RP726_05470 [Candidatus Methylospira mobilis]
MHTKLPTHQAILLICAESCKKLEKRVAIFRETCRDIPVSGRSEKIGDNFAFGGPGHPRSTRRRHFSLADDSTLFRGPCRIPSESRPALQLPGATRPARFALLPVSQRELTRVFNSSRNNTVEQIINDAHDKHIKNNNGNFNDFRKK